MMSTTIFCWPQQTRHTYVKWRIHGNNSVHCYRHDGFIYPENFFKERVLICLKGKVNCLSFPLNLSAVMCQNVLWLREILAVLQSPSHSAGFSSSGPGCLLFMFHCVPVHKASLVNWLAQQKLSCSVTTIWAHVSPIHFGRFFLYF